MLGPIDMDLLQKGRDTHKYFTNEYDLYHINEVCVSISLIYIFNGNISLNFFCFCINIK